MVSGSLWGGLEQTASSRPSSHAGSVQSPGVANSGLGQLCGGAETAISGLENSCPEQAPKACPHGRSVIFPRGPPGSVPPAHAFPFQGLGALQRPLTGPVGAKDYRWGGGFSWQGWSLLHPGQSLRGLPGPRSTVSPQLLWQEAGQGRDLGTRQESLSCGKETGRRASSTFRQENPQGGIGGPQGPFACHHQVLAQSP